MATRVVVVTGGGRGIGRAIALGFAAQRRAVGVLDLQPGTVAEEIVDGGGRAINVRADVTDLASMRAAIAQVEDQLGPIGVLVNNAGWDKLDRFLESDPPLWDKLIAINYKGALNTTRAVLERMAGRGAGRIVSIASDAGRVGSSGEAVYSGCKAAIIGFSKALAREVAKDGITVNCVCPGPTDTALLAEVMAGTGEKVLHGMRRAIPMGRLGQPEDVVGAVCFLASDAAAFVTGQVLSVSGGLTMVG
jgi:2-hydroxycyclohexanecarboxyl-CoA dehydrogenase